MQFELIGVSSTVAAHVNAFCASKVKEALSAVSAVFRAAFEAHHAPAIVEELSAT